jgi:uncharacterized protein DUF6459
MSTAAEVRTDIPPAIRLRPAPRCDPPFDDELPPNVGVSADQLTFPWPLTAARPAGGFSVAAGVPSGGAGTDGMREVGVEGSTARPAVSSGCASGAGTPGDARLAVRRFVSVCVEVLNGYRPAAHLRRLSLPMEAPSVVAQGVAGARRVAELRQATRPADRRARRPGPVGVLRVLLCEPRAGVVEAAVLLITGERTWAMAFRLELHQQKWAATALRLI